MGNSEKNTRKNRNDKRKRKFNGTLHKANKKSDEKEKQPYRKGLKKWKPNRDDWKQKGVKRKWCKKTCDESK